MTILINEMSSCICGSMSFTENIEGFKVCLGCGQVQNDLNLVCTVPKSQHDFIYHRPIGYTFETNKLQMGTKRERINSKMRRVFILNYLNRVDTHKKITERDVYFEMMKITSGLNLDKNMHLLIYRTYLKIQDELPKYHGIRSPARISAVLIYSMVQTENLGISIEDVANLSILTTSQIYKYLSEFQHIFQTKRNNANNLAIAKISDICQKNKINSKIEMEAIELLDNTHPSNSNIIATSLVYIALRNNNIKIAPHRLTNKTPGCNGSVYSYVKKYLKYPDDYSFIKMAKEVWKN